MFPELVASAPPINTTSSPPLVAPFATVPDRTLRFAASLRSLPVVARTIRLARRPYRFPMAGPSFIAKFLERLLARLPLYRDREGAPLGFRWDGVRFPRRPPIYHGDLRGRQMRQSEISPVSEYLLRYFVSEISERFTRPSTQPIRRLPLRPFNVNLPPCWRYMSR